MGDRELYETQLTGPIPDLSTLSNCKYLYESNPSVRPAPVLPFLASKSARCIYSCVCIKAPLVSQLFSGSIPGNRWLYENQLTGPIPNVAGLTALVILCESFTSSCLRFASCCLWAREYYSVSPLVAWHRSLYGNSLSGTIPEDITELHSLSSL